MRIFFVFLCVFAPAICQAQNPHKAPPPRPPPIFNRGSYGIKVNTNNYRQPSVAAKTTTNNNNRNNAIHSNIRNTNYQQPSNNYRLPITSITNYKLPNLPSSRNNNKNKRNNRPRSNIRPATNNNQPAAAAKSWLPPPYSRPSAQDCKTFCRRSSSSMETRCGMDNVTYESDCVLDCVGMQKMCDGICPCRYEHPAPNSGCWCWREDIDPVCTMDGSTVGSPCEARCERKHVVRDGPCWSNPY